MESMKNKGRNYSEFVFLSAGPVGDHALIIDYANRFFESTGKPSTILLKHPNTFLRDMAIPYYDHISYIPFLGLKGKVETFLFALTSIWKKRCYVLVLPIPPPRYLTVFARYINSLTHSRMIALDSPCGFILPGGPFPSGQFVGEGNYIPANVDKELYYEEANQMLQFLGYESVPRVPHLAYVDTPSVVSEYALTDVEYIAMHIKASGPDRSLPADRWNVIIKTLAEKLPNTAFVFTGTNADMDFISESARGIEENRVRYLSGVSTQELLTVYAHAKMCVTVHTGNAHLINMLHVPCVTVNFKGVHMFRFDYNEKGVDLYSEKGCTCNPYERRCSMVEYRGQEYMACLFNLTNEEIVNAIVKRYPSE